MSLTSTPEEELLDLASKAWALIGPSKTSGAVIRCCGPEREGAHLRH